MDALTAEVAERGATAAALQAQLAAAAERHGAGMADAERQRQVGSWGSQGLLCCGRCTRSWRPPRSATAGSWVKGYYPTTVGCISVMGEGGMLVIRVAALLVQWQSLIYTAICCRVRPGLGAAWHIL